MSEDEARVLITHTFNNIKLDSYEYLQCHGNILFVCENQKLIGNNIINLVGSGSLYIKELMRIYSKHR